MNTPKPQLDATDHDRDSAGMTYVYPVVSRRARGVSIGINLNPNNACNWRCIYCQVPNLTRGAAPEIDLEQLERELRTMLQDILHGTFMQQRVPEEARRLEDIAFSGNGEPTSSAEFGAAIVIVERVLRDFGLLGQLPVRLITNGSLIEKPGVLDAIRHLGQINGEVWFKVDAATAEGIARINDVRLNPQGVLERLRLCAQACPTWVQTCVFALDGEPPSELNVVAYLDLLLQAKNEIKGIHLYGLARPSLQVEAPRLARLSQNWLNDLGVRIGRHGIPVRVSA
ncbi:MAG TPA: radical SAM protein [Methylophilaceae bacterium]|jgi:wyosine [tRNA(Phe)-imidazoG37] synthetase (radical SAM superfamily)|nr:radical SAM protein [Methylophilaceae bacterium]